MTEIEPTPAEPMKPGTISLATQLIAFIAGIASGLAFVQLYTGTGLGVFLAYMSPLPLFLVGLTCGRAASLTAVLFGILAIFLRTAPEIAVFYTFLFAVPVGVLTRVALIRNEQGAFVSGGTVLIAALTLGTVMMMIVAILLELYSEGMSKVVQIPLDAYKAMVLENNVNDLTPAQIDYTLNFIKPALPGFILTGWFLILTVTGVFSQWFASEIKKNLRATPLMKKIELPMWMVGVFLAALIGSFFVPEDTQMVLLAISSLYAIGFIIGGLGVMHRWLDAYMFAREWSDGKRMAVYILVYAVIFILQIPGIFLLLFGLIAPFTAWRHSLKNGHSGTAH